MILVGIRRTEYGFLCRLGLGIVSIVEEHVMRARLGLKPDKWQGRAVEATIRKVGENSFLLEYTDTDTGEQFAKVYGTLNEAMKRLSRVQFEAFKASA